MKARLTGLFLGISLLGAADTATANVKAPPGCRFEVQVRMQSIRQYGGRLLYSYRWQTLGDPFQWLSKAEDVYDPLVAADQAGKLYKYLGGPFNQSAFPVDVRLVLICESKSPLIPDEVIVIDSTYDSR